MITNFYDVPPVIMFDLVDVLCGKLLGNGIARQVYECRIDPSLVVKIEYESGSFQNTVEWELWNNIKHTDYAKWFAPCDYISSCGSVLLMKKTTPIKKYPEKLPVFLTDTKRTNYGMYKGHVCCHDYGMNNLYTTGLTKRIRKADWWDL